MSRSTIVYKLKSFPHVSETFIVSNIVYALKKGYKVQLYVTKYLGIRNASQTETLEQYGLENMVQEPVSLSQHRLKRWIQLASITLHPRVFSYVFKYYKYESNRNSEPILQLYQYRNFKKNTVCHLHFNNALHPLPQLANIGFIKPKCIITFHGYDAFLENRESFQAKYGDFYTKYVRAVTVNSQYLKTQLVTLGIKESLIKIIPIGIDITNFRGKQKRITTSQTINLITIGRLMQLKGHTYAIDAVKKIKDAGYDIQYTIVGEGQSLNKLQEQVAELGLTKTVFFKGKATQEQVKQALNEAHIFLMPSTYDDITGRREAFGLVSIEAQAMGLPIIGFMSGGFPDTIKQGDTGFAVDDRNTSEMADKVKYLIDNPAIYTRMSKTAMKHAAAFDHQYTTQKYIGLYEENI